MHPQPSERAKKVNRRGEITVLMEKSCRLEGKLFFEGTARLDGEFKGEIHSSDTLIIGKSAQVEGEIHVPTVMVIGKFEGKIIATERVDLLKSSYVKGTIESKELQIEPGALFEGESKTLIGVPEPALTPPCATVN